MRVTKKKECIISWTTNGNNCLLCFFLRSEAVYFMSLFFKKAVGFFTVLCLTHNHSYMLAKWDQASLHHNPAVLNADMHNSMKSINLMDAVIQMNIWKFVVTVLNDNTRINSQVLFILKCHQYTAIYDYFTHHWSAHASGVKGNICMEKHLWQNGKWYKLCLFVRADEIKMVGGIGD